jgi:hypothetical protein
LSQYKNSIKNPKKSLTCPKYSGIFPLLPILSQIFPDGSPKPSGEVSSVKSLGI